VLGGACRWEVDVDFFGGQQAAAGNRNFPLLRLRRAIGTVQWTHVQILLGQETALVSDRNPRSLAGVGVPDFSNAGNLWFWIPQARVTWEYGYTLRLAVQGAVLAPISGAPQGALTTQADSGERSGRPYVEGRVRLGWGPTDDPSEVAIGGHIGWLRGFDSLTGDSLLQSRAVTFDTRLKFGPAEILGEAFIARRSPGWAGAGSDRIPGSAARPCARKADGAS